MKKCLIIAASLALLCSCAKEEPVTVKAAFSTNKDVFQVNEEILISNESTVENDILAFCKWKYGADETWSYAYTLDLEGISFTVPGEYTISLTAYAEAGAGMDTCTKTVFVVDENDIPWADFECPSEVKVNTDVVFEDKSVDRVGGIEFWRWDIGGQESTYQSPRIVFTEAVSGMEVTLTVTDTYGAKSSVTKVIDVIE